MDPRFVFRTFDYFELAFLTVIGYASFDAKKLNRPRHFLAN